MFQKLFQRQKKKALYKILENLQFGKLHLTMPDNSTHDFFGSSKGPVTDLHIHNEAAIGRILKDGKIGFCEAFMDGDVTSQSLANFIELAARHDEYFERKLKTNFFRKLGLKLFHTLHHNSLRGSARNIAHHYDLGNNFYEAWLDPTMTYSSAVFDKDDDDLTTAQLNKYRHLARLADIQPNDTVLEIGCGWGGFAKYVSSEIGAHITGITISKEQLSYANKVISEAGLSQRARFELKDYRDLEGRFDKVVSIEMFEAVGESYWPVYFQTLSKVLKNGGRAVLQSITIDDNLFSSYRSQPDFIQRYIFPGGMLPSLPNLKKPVTEAGLKLVTETGYASHYARTLGHWRNRFNDAWPQLATKNFDQKFKRKWELYLAYCEGGFRAGLIDLKQLLFMHK